METRASRKQQYKALLDRGGNIRKDVEITNKVAAFEKISQIVKENNVLNKEGNIRDRTDNPTEVALDAQVLKMSHELVETVMQKMGASEFSDEEFINSIMRVVYKDDNENWDALTEAAVQFARTFNVSSSLVGTLKKLDTPVEVAKERQQRKKVALAEEERPDTVKALNKKQKGAQKMNYICKEIMKIYEKNSYRPIPYFKLIVDPENFMYTIDNAFQVAFLIKDGSLLIETGEDGFPQIRPTTKEEKSATSNETTQAIASLNTALCNMMIKQYKIKAPLLKFREVFDENQSYSESFSQS